MEENFSPQDSLQLIESMIQKTKANISYNRFYFLLWGWITFGAIVVQFILKVVLHYERHYLVWLVTFIGMFISIVHARKMAASHKVRTYIGDSMGYLWTGVGISFSVLCIVISVGKTGWQNAYPFFIIFYGMGTFVSGKILQFKPLIIGGIINWVLAAASVFFPFDYQLLFAAAAILTSYLIPGYLLKPQKKMPLYGR